MMYDIKELLNFICDMMSPWDTQMFTTHKIEDENSGVMVLVESTGMFFIYNNKKDHVKVEEVDDYLKDNNICYTHLQTGLLEYLLKQAIMASEIYSRVKRIIGDQLVEAAEFEWDLAKKEAEEEEKNKNKPKLSVVKDTE